MQAWKWDKCKNYDVGVVQECTYVFESDGMFTETMEGLILSLFSPHFNLSHHLLLWQMCFPSKAQAVHVMLSSPPPPHSPQSSLIGSHMLRVCRASLSICCGFSRNSDYIIVTSQTVKIRQAQKLTAPGIYISVLCWAWIFVKSQRNLRSEQTGLSQCETELTIGVEPIWSQQYKKNRKC